jgi:hypothetical protein
LKWHSLHTHTSPLAEVATIIEELQEDDAGRGGSLTVRDVNGFSVRSKVPCIELKVVSLLGYFSGTLVNSRLKIGKQGESWCGPGWKFRIPSWFLRIATYAQVDTRAYPPTLEKLAKRETMRSGGMEMFAGSGISGRRRACGSGRHEESLS